MSLQSYVVGKDAKVICQRNYINPAEVKDGCRFVMAYNKMDKEGNFLEDGEWKTGEMIDPKCRVSVPQLFAINEVNKSALQKCMIQAAKDAI